MATARAARATRDVSSPPLLQRVNCLKRLLATTSELIPFFGHPTTVRTEEQWVLAIRKKKKRERTKFVSFHPGWIKFPVVGIDKAKQARTAVVACSSMCTAVRYQIT